MLLVAVALLSPWLRWSRSRWWPLLCRAGALVNPYPWRASELATKFRVTPVAQVESVGWWTWRAVPWWTRAPGELAAFSFQVPRAELVPWPVPSPEWV